MISAFRTLKENVFEATLSAYREGLFAGTSGNLSLCDPARKVVAITPTSQRYESMSADDIVVIDLDGKTVEGALRPSSEWKMHTEIYKQRSDVFAVVHTHSPYATSFAVARKSIPTILIEMIGFLGGEVPVAGFEMPGSAELGRSALEVLHNRNACLMSNHGVVAIGATLQQAHIRAVYVEDAAKIYHMALQTGDVSLVPEEAVRKMKAKFGIKD
jgi:L-ribulose-5-phosphate 4-epimerase